MNLSAKFNKLQTGLRNMGKVLVAFSGGIDSTLLLKVAHDTLGDNVIAVTATSPTDNPEDLSYAMDFVRNEGVRHILLPSSELNNPNFVKNSPDRCYFCKLIRFQEILALAKELKIAYILDGSNVDDTGDFRPGNKAVRELGIYSPLKEAGLTKSEIRSLAREFNLPWDKPSSACLASRIPYGSQITPDKLEQIKNAEILLKNLGFRELRVRHHDLIARIEIPQALFSQILQSDPAQQIIAGLKELGFRYITLDLEGLRQGSLNEVLSDDEKTSFS